MPISIYLVDQPPFGNLGFEDLCETIIQKINKSEEGINHFEEQVLQDKDYGESEIKIYHSIKTRPPGWRSFLKNVVHKDEKLMKQQYRFLFHSLYRLPN